MLGSLGSQEIVIIAVIVLILFGGKKIPEFFKGLGESVKEFRKAANDHDEEKKED